MWPFTKVKTYALSMSGVLTCDGKHHSFTAWKDVILTRTIYQPWMNDPLSFPCDAQERTCVICHYKERRLTK